MALKFTYYVELPAHERGGFDHAAVHTGLNRVYVAHTANDSVDVIDGVEDRYLHSISGLSGVAGVLVSEASNLIFTSNRGEDTVGIFSPDNESALIKIPVGIHPNVLAYDDVSDMLLVAHVGDPAILDSITVSLIRVATRHLVATLPVPGRTRWTVFDSISNSFYVNIADPALIVMIDAAHPIEITRLLPFLFRDPMDWTLILLMVIYFVRAMVGNLLP